MQWSDESQIKNLHSHSVPILACRSQRPKFRVTAVTGRHTGVLSSVGEIPSERMRHFTPVFSEMKIPVVLLTDSPHPFLESCTDRRSPQKCLVNEDKGKYIPTALLLSFTVTTLYSQSPGRDTTGVLSVVSRDRGVGY